MKILLQIKMCFGCETIKNEFNSANICIQSDLPYDSMDHPNFKKCWSLDNLRPLSAKQNCLDGVNKMRHKSKKRIRNIIKKEGY